MQERSFQQMYLRRQQRFAYLGTLCVSFVLLLDRVPHSLTHKTGLGDGAYLTQSSNAPMSNSGILSFSLPALFFAMANGSPRTVPKKLSSLANHYVTPLCATIVKKKTDNRALRSSQQDLRQFVSWPLGLLSTGKIIRFS